MMLTMAVECTHDAILTFLLENGGKVKNTDLIEHFKAVFPEEPERKAAARETFKTYVDSLAFVKSERGVKHVCLRKKFRATASDRTEMEPVKAAESTDTVPYRYPERAAEPAPLRAEEPAPLRAEEPAPLRAARGCEQQAAPGSGYGNDSQVRVPHNFNTESILQDKADEKTRCPQFVCVVEGVDSSSAEMGNWESFRRDKRESKKEQAGKALDIPEIIVTDASPLPAERAVFTLPGPAQTGSTGQVDTAAGFSPTHRQAETEAPSQEDTKEAEQVMVARRTNSKGCQHRFVSGQLESEEEEEEEGNLDTHSLSGSEDNSTPKGSRKHFIEVMMNSSLQVRRSVVLRNAVYLSSRSDTDSTSVVSSTLEEDRVTLEPVEHEWMMCASDGEWGSLHRLLATEPSLILRKDFVTGFTCLHWAAKHGKPELIAMIINFAKQHNIPISVDTRSNTGYTPLHIAAMHSRMEVVKLLVGAYNADVDIRDYSGRKACQYLTDNVSTDIRDIIGAYEHSEAENTDARGTRHWRISNLKPLRLFNPSDSDSVEREGQPREKPLRRKSSLSRMKPKLQRLRARTSQIVHSASFKDREEEEGSKKGSFRSRPKSYFFGL